MYNWALGMFADKATNDTMNFDNIINDMTLNKPKAGNRGQYCPWG
jgi:hypothetical protein